MAKKDQEIEKKEGKKAEKPAKASKKEKAKKPNFFVRLGKRLKETFSELKRVTWPTLPQALKATGVVLVITLIFLILVTGINIGLNELLKFLTGLGG